jgi:hypothetical protein
MVKTLEFEICAGIGDNLVIRIFLDSIKHNYNRISIAHSRSVINYYRGGDQKYYNFLSELSKLIFSEPPFFFDPRGKFPPIHTEKVITELASKPKLTNLDKVLCKGTPLDVGEEYIVLTTKVRCLNRSTFLPLSVQFWAMLRELSKKYKIVVMGERVVEISKEYKGSENSIFGIYEQIIANVPQDRLVDKTIPALGITIPNMANIQQDCLIMKNAKLVITLGIGGNFWLSAAVANTLGFRDDVDKVTDYITNPNYPTVFTTRDWSLFMSKLQEYK